MSGWNDILATAALLGRQFQKVLGRPREAQLRLLQRIVASNAGSHFGQTFRFDRIVSLEDYRRLVPIQTYEDFSPWIERCAAGEGGVLTVESVIAFEETGGSSAGTKLIPYTQSSLLAFRAAILPWIGDLLARRPAISRGRTYVSVSPATRRQRVTAGGHPIGLPSEGAYLGTDLADAFRAILVADDSIGSLTDMKEWKIATLCQLVASQDLTLISVWSPSFLLRLMDALVDNFDLVTARLSHSPETADRLQRALSGKQLRTDIIWPSLNTISCWMDGPSEVIARQVARLFPSTFIEPKGILATESAISLPWGTHPNAVPALLSVFLEFVDGAGRAKLVDEVSKGEEYRIILTTPGGLYRYDIGDRVRCTGHTGKVPRLEFLGRVGLVSDLVGEKLTEDFVTRVLGSLEWPAMLAAQVKPRPHYEVWIDTPAVVAPDALARDIEDQLGKNPQYAYARAMGQIGPLAVCCRPGFLNAHHDMMLSKGRRLGDLKPVSLLPWAGSPDGHSC